MKFYENMNKYERKFFIRDSIFGGSVYGGAVVLIVTNPSIVNFISAIVVIQLYYFAFRKSMWRKFQELETQEKLNLEVE